MDENDTCRVFGKISYRELKSVTRTIRNRCFAGQKDLVSPQHLILDSGGRVIKKYFLEKKPKEFIRILNESLALFQGKTPARTMKDEVAALEKALKSKDDGVRAGAFKKALEFLTEDKDNRKVHQAAARYLKSRKSFLKILDELTAISTAGSEGALALLVPYLKNKSPRMRRCVLDVFARSAPCKTFLKPLEKRVKAEKQEAPLRSLVKVLDKYAGVFKEALPPLNKLASNKQNSIKALATLAAARPDNKAIYKILLARSRKKIDILVRSAAILGLGSMRAKEALPTLQTVRKKEQKNAPLVQVLNATIDILGGAPGSAVDEADMMVLEMEINRIKREVVVSGASDDNPAGLSGGRNGRGGGGRSGRGGAGSDGR